MTIPKIKGLRWQYSRRWDEQPAAKLGSSLLRLEICQPGDWAGDPVDFVERGFRRFCRANGLEQASRVWEGDLRILDHLFELSEHQRNEIEEPARTLFLVADFSAAASIPLGPTLPVLEREHPHLPAAFHAAFRHCLRKWMLVYDYSAAAEHAEMGMVHWDEEEPADSVYPKVSATVPASLQRRLNMNPYRALSLLKRLQPTLKGKTARELVQHLLHMYKRSRGYRHAWPGYLSREIPGLDDYLEECDGLGPGCLLNWYENDAISACFDEEMTYIGQNGPLGPSILRAIRLDRPRKLLEQQLKSLFNYVATMIRCLACAANIVQIIRELSDENIREDRVSRGLQADPSASDVRQE